MDYHLLCMSSVLFHHLLCAGQLQCLFESMDLIKKLRKREILEEGTKRNILINVGDSAEIRTYCQNRGIDLSKGLSLGECNYPTDSCHDVFTDRCSFSLNLSRI